jgi:PAS domain S-box-containing protein
MSMNDEIQREQRAKGQARPQHKALSSQDPLDDLASQASVSPYLNFFELAPSSYFILDSQGKIIDVNLSATQLLGVDRSKLRQDYLINYVAPDCRGFFKRKLQEAGIDATQHSFDLQFMLPENEVRHVHIDVLTQNAENGQALSYLTVTDIPKQKLAESRLWENNKYIKSLFTFASGPIVVCDTLLKITMINPAAEKLTGYSAEELIGRSVHLFFSSSRDDLLTPGTQLALEGQQLTSLEEVTMHHVSGAIKFISWASAPIYAEDGQAVVSILAHGQDITERIQVEQCLHIASSAFEAQLGKLILDHEKKIIRVNTAFCRMTGYGNDEVVGRPIHSFLGAAHENDKFLTDLWNRVSREHYWQGELCDFRKNGENSPVFMTIATVLGDQAQETHYVASFIDIKVQKKVESLLHNRHLHLGKQVVQTVAELGHWKEETDDANSALKAMIKLREIESLEAKKNLLLELEQEVMPFLVNLKKISGTSKQMRLLGALEANLQRLVESYGCLMGVASIYRNLTPKEIQVASMVREGFSTKVIAATLSISPETVSIHRKNIRKKLGLGTKADNLRSHLVTLASGTRES